MGEVDDSEISGSGEVTTYNRKYFLNYSYNLPETEYGQLLFVQI